MDSLGRGCGVAADRRLDQAGRAAGDEQACLVAAWDYYHKRLQGAPGETRHHVYWTADYVGRDAVAGASVFNWRGAA